MAEELQNTDQKSSYRGIMKATSLFGGVQVYQILIEIVKSKFIAVLLGPTGVGIQGLYTSGTQMIQQLSSLGLSQSATRNIAEAYGSGDQTKISKTVTALRKLVWITGLLGMLVVICASPLLSQSSFGDYAHIWGFVAISVVLLFNQINAGQRVLLRGMRKYKFLAKSTAFGVTIGLFVSVPLYYIWGINAIVPNIIISSITSLLLSWHFSRKIPVDAVKQSWSEVFGIGKSMIIMGIAMSLTQFLSLASSYILRSSIRLWGSIDEVGLYTAGFILMTQYTGMVFQAMGTDFYPRLAAVNKDNEKCVEIMNQQGEVGLLLLGPLMTLCVVFIPVVIKILYSDAFLSINDYIIWSAVGVIFQMAAWSVSYILIAKAESQLYTINEIVVCLYGLGLNLLGYYMGGLTGLGISFAIKYILYLLQVYLIARARYSFRFTPSFLRIFAQQLVLVLSGVIVVLFVFSWWRYVCGSVICFITTILALYELNKRMDIMSFVNQKLHKNGK